MTEKLPPNGIHSLCEALADIAFMAGDAGGDMNITVSPRVIHALKVKEAIARMGKKWLLHESNRVKKLDKPYGGRK